jgi:hypothetical protein
MINFKIGKTWINYKDREFFIDENGIACEILENGDSTSDFEVPEELKSVLKKESAQDVRKT